MIQETLVRSPGLVSWERGGDRSLPGGHGLCPVSGKAHCYLLGSAFSRRAFLGESRAAVKRHGLFGKPGTGGHDAGIPFWNPGTREESGGWIGV